MVRIQTLSKELTVFNCILQHIASYNAQAYKAMHCYKKNQKYKTHIYSKNVLVIAFFAMWNAIKSNYEYSHCVICNDTTIAWPCLLCKYLFLKRCIHLLAFAAFIITLCMMFPTYYVLGQYYILAVVVIMQLKQIANGFVYFSHEHETIAQIPLTEKIIKRQRLIRIVVLYADCFSSVALYTIPGFDFTH